MASNILLVDDDPAVRTAYQRVLEQAGWVVTAVGSGAEALKALGQQQYAAMVCDLILPAREGTSIYQDVIDAFPHMANHVVFITGWAHDTKARKLLEHTGRPVLQKPVEAGQLVATVRAVAGAG